MDETKPLLSTDTPSTNNTAAATSPAPLEQPPPYTEEPAHPSERNRILLGRKRLKGAPISVDKHSGYLLCAKNKSFKLFLTQL